MILMGIHSMGAAILKVPELELAKHEAERLGEAVAKVNRLYGGRMMSEKQAAWVNLMMVAGTVYGPRIGTVMLKNAAKKAPQAKTVTVQ
jgi:ribosomal protein L3